MPPGENQPRPLFLAQLTKDELEHAILYESSVRVPAGRLKIAPMEITVPWEARLAFVDREPGANWGHSSRYILLNAETGETLTVESRFPPFQGNAMLQWRTIYKAATAPDWAVAAPKEE
jgi:hypothetical protein